MTPKDLNVEDMTLTEVQRFTDALVEGRVEAASKIVGLEPDDVREYIFVTNRAVELRSLAALGKELTFQQKAEANFGATVTWVLLRELPVVAARRMLFIATALVIHSGDEGGVVVPFRTQPATVASRPRGAGRRASRVDPTKGRRR